MANIGISLHNNAKVEVGQWRADSPDCLIVAVGCDLPPVVGGSGNPIPFARDQIALHGSADEIRSFAEKIIATLSLATSSLSPVAATHTGSPASNAETTTPNTNAFGLGSMPLVGRDIQSGVVPECPHPAPEREIEARSAGDSEKVGQVAH